MQNRAFYSGVITLAMASVLSACAPNPYVLQDRVYDRYPPPQPRYTPSSPVTARPMPAPRPPVQAPVQAPADSRTLPLPTEIPPTVEVVQEVPSTEAVQTYKKYESSSAVRALLKQANAEIADGKLADASATIERALRMEPDNPDLWLKLSDLNKRQGNAQQAANMASKAQYYQELLN
jgi:tetratricopeptide (TPR) repeat protein